jgi:hypothetical protein
MAKNSHRRAAKKTAAKKAIKANQLKLQKRAQTENATAMLDKGLGLVYSVSVSVQFDTKSAVSETSQRQSRHHRHHRYQTVPFKWAVISRNC